MPLVALLIIGVAVGFLASRILKVNMDTPSTIALGVLGALIGTVVLRGLVMLAGLNAAMFHARGGLRQVHRHRQQDGQPPQGATREVQCRLIGQPVHHGSDHDDACEQAQPGEGQLPPGVLHVLLHEGLSPVPMVSVR